MWVSQTYLGNINEKSDVYIYYFWENYAQQPEIDDSVLDSLSELGYSFRDRVSVFVPRPSHLGLIREEMRNKFERFWRTFSGKTPGLFFITKPLSSFDPTLDNWLFLPITNELVADKPRLRVFFEELHKKCDTVILHNFNENNSELSIPTSRKLLKALYDSLQLKVSVLGVGIDLKPIISHLRRHTR